MNGGDCRRHRSPIAEFAVRRSSACSDVQKKSMVQDDIGIMSVLDQWNQSGVRCQVANLERS